MPGSLDCLGQRALVLSTGAGFSPGTDLTGVLYEPLQDVGILVVNRLAWICAKLTGPGPSPESPARAIV